MKFAVKNLKDTPHTICRFNGQKVKIQPKETITVNTDDVNEYNYWKSLKREQLNLYGLDVILDEDQILKANNSNYVDASIVDGFVSPIAKEIASSTKVKVEEEVNTNTSDDTYTEENLMKMDKEDLFNICDNFGIKYKRNNSVKTLVGLILESGVV